MGKTICIKGLDKAEVLAALYNASSPRGMGFLHARGSLTRDEAKVLLKQTTYFDYLYGRVMKVDLGGNELHTALYDRDNGDDAARNALAHLLSAA